MIHDRTLLRSLPRKTLLFKSAWVIEYRRNPISVWEAYGDPMESEAVATAMMDALVKRIVTKNLYRLREILVSGDTPLSNGWIGF